MTEVQLVYLLFTAIKKIVVVCCSLDTAGQSMSSPRLEGRKGNDQRSLPTCHASVMNLSEELNTPSLFEKKKLQEAESEETSSKRSKGKETN